MFANASKEFLISAKMDSASVCWGIVLKNIDALVG
jgi:hypothetical protein